MSLAALFNLGGSEVILTLALILILLGAKRLPELDEGLWQGIWEFRKAARKVIEEPTGQKAGDVLPSHPVLMALTFILGGACLILVQSSEPKKSSLMTSQATNLIPRAYWELKSVQDKIWAWSQGFHPIRRFLQQPKPQCVTSEWFEVTLS